MIKLINKEEFDSEQKYQRALNQVLNDIKIHNKLNIVDNESKMTKEQILEILNGKHTV